MSVRDCPKCGLVNPPSAQRCDCGYDFMLRRIQASYLGKPPERSGVTTFESLVCFFIPLLGLVIGVAARQQGRREAGNMMLIISFLLAGPLIGTLICMAMRS
jgi:hypothetical protein